MKKTITSCFLFLPIIIFSQNVFEGKIVYTSSPTIKDSSKTTFYFSKGKIRMNRDLHGKKNTNAQSADVICFLDSNQYYFIDH